MKRKQMTTAATLKKFINDNKLTRAQAAKKLGCNEKKISNILFRNRMPADFLDGVTVAAFTKQPTKYRKMFRKNNPTNNIKALEQYVGMFNTQVSAANELGVSENALSNWLRSGYAPKAVVLLAQERLNKSPSQNKGDLFVAYVGADKQEMFHAYCKAAGINMVKAPL